MDPQLARYLEEHKISYKVHNHPPLFTVEESRKLRTTLEGVMHTKNLFLRDESIPRKFFLISMYADDMLNLKSLVRKLGAKKKLSFASEGQLRERLNISPGSVSIFGMIYAKDVTLVVDKRVWSAKRVGFHPNINTSTLELTHENLKKFYNSLDTDKLIITLE